MEIIDLGGLTVFLDSQPVSKDDVWASNMEPGIWLGTLLDGQVNVRRAGTSNQWGRGTTGLFWNEHPAESEHKVLLDGKLSGVFVHIPADDVEAVLTSGDLDSLRHTISCSDTFDAATLGALAWQMLGSRLSGPARRLQIGGKALEMLAHVLDRSVARNNETGSSSRRAWRPRDIERFHEARSLLLTELRSPPSMPEVAQRLGIGVRTLSAGFADLFGQSPYAFLKEQRLQASHRLLEAGGWSIASIAYEFGYQPNHFTTLFRQRFGYPPSRLKSSK